MSLKHYLVLIVVAGLATVAAVPFAKWLAGRLSMVALPGGRRIHKIPIPESGGTAMLIGIIIMLAIQVLGENLLDWRGFGTDMSTPLSVLTGVGLGAGIIFAVGFVDDMLDITPGAKLLGQIVAALVVALSGLRLDFISNPFDGSLILLGDTLGIILTVIYLVSFANIINLIDGLDGLAAGISGIAAISLVVIAAGSNQLAAAILAAGIIGATIGFLVFNFPPATIFMGDQGALMLGFLLGVISLTGVMKTTAAIALAVPLLIVGVPIFDTLSAIVRRVRSNRPIKEADKGHIHHRLLGRGFGQRQTLLIIYVWSALLGIGGYTVRYAPVTIRLVAVGVMLVLTALISYWLGIFESAYHHGGPRSWWGRDKGNS